MIYLILLLSIILRLINVNQSLWLDEAAQVTMSQLSIQEIIFGRIGDFHPPLSYIIYHYWLNFGRSEIILRLPTILAGAGSVFAIYLLGKSLFSKKTGLLAAFLLCVNPFHIYYSQEVRMYSFACLFSLISTYFFMMNTKQMTSNKKISIGYVISSLLLLFTHYMGGFIILSQLMIALVFRQTRNYLNLFLVFIFSIPLLPLLFSQLKSGVNIDDYLPGWRSILSLSPLKSIPLTLFKFTAGRIDFLDNRLYFLIISITLLLIGLIIFRIVRKNTGLVILKLFMLFVVPVVLTLLISFKIPLFQPFRLIIILPILILLEAISLAADNLINKFLLAGLLTVSVLGFLVQISEPRLQREDWKGASQFVSKNLKIDSVAVFAWPIPFPPFEWYVGSENTISLIEKFPADSNTFKKHESQIASKKSLYLFEYLQDLSDPKRLTQQWLNEHNFILEQRYNFEGVGFIDYYERSP